MAELPMMVYYRQGTGLMGNLYTASSAIVELDGLSLTVRQETDYPGSGDILLRLDPSRPAAFPVSLRIPGWCTGATVTVNDQPVDAAVESGKLLVIDRMWQAGDRVQLRMPMAYRWVNGRKLQDGRAALLRGPVLFCLNPARNESLTGVDPGEVTVDPASVVGPFDDTTIRPGGQACRVRAESPSTKLTLIMTEFADPGGEVTHMKVAESDGLIDDELMGSV
jgi:hypothetical protein